MAKQMVKALAADMIATKGAKQTAAADQAAEAGGAGEPLNFRVTPDFRRRFRQFALDHDMRLSAVLVEAFAALLREKGEG